MGPWAWWQVSITKLNWEDRSHLLAQFVCRIHPQDISHKSLGETNHFPDNECCCFLSDASCCPINVELASVQRLRSMTMFAEFIWAARITMIKTTYALQSLLLLPVCYWFSIGNLSNLLIHSQTSTAAPQSPQSRRLQAAANTRIKLTSLWVKHFF